MAGFATASSTTPRSFLNRAPDQVAFVVEDFEKGVNDIGRQMGIGRWLVWDYTTDYLPNRSYAGHPSDYRSLVAMPDFGPSVEVIQPIAGPSIYTQYVAVRGSGLHHIGYYVDDLAEARDHFGALGLEPVMTGGGHGVDGDGEFLFYDFLDRYGYFLEVVVPPKARHPHHREIEVR